MTYNIITASIVPENHRSAFLPGLVGPRRMLRAESLVYRWANFSSPDYNGGYWEYYRLSNGGGYMAPRRTERLKVAIAGNSFEHELGPDAFGIVCTFFAFGMLAAECEADGEAAEQMAELYHALRDFAGEHPEHERILAAID